MPLLGRMRSPLCCFYAKLLGWDFSQGRQQLAKFIDHISCDRFDFDRDRNINATKQTTRCVKRIVRWGNRSFREDEIPRLRSFHGESHRCTRCYFLRPRNRAGISGSPLTKVSWYSGDFFCRAFIGPFRNRSVSGLGVLMRRFLGQRTRLATLLGTEVGSILWLYGA